MPHCCSTAEVAVLGSLSSVRKHEVDDTWYVFAATKPTWATRPVACLPVVPSWLAAGSSSHSSTSFAANAVWGESDATDPQDVAAAARRVIAAAVAELLEVVFQPVNTEQLPAITLD